MSFCPACSYSNIEYIGFSGATGSPIIKCKNCGFKYSIKRFSSTEDIDDSEESEIDNKIF